MVGEGAVRGTWAVEGDPEDRDEGDEKGKKGWLEEMGKGERGAIRENIAGPNLPHHSHQQRKRSNRAVEAEG